MNFKKIIAAASAAALSAGVMAASALAATTSDAVIDWTPTADGYEYAGYVGSLTGNEGDVLAIDITTKEGTNLTELRLEFTDPKKVCWASQNDEGTLFTMDGKTLVESEFAAGEKKTVYIDLAKSGASASDFHIHTSGKATGSFKLENITLMSKAEYDEAVKPVPAETVTEAPEASDNAGGTDTTTAGSAGDTDKNNPDKQQPNTGVESVAVVAGAAIVAAVAVVIAKKRK